MRGARRILGAVAAVLVLAAGAGVAVAVSFSGTTTNAANTFSSTTVVAPTGLTASGTPTVTLGWTATASTWAAGHRVYRGTSSGGPYTEIADITPRTTVSAQDTPGYGTYYYVVRGYFGATWESGNSNVASIELVDPTFYFENGTANTGTLCLTSTRRRDMDSGTLPSDPFETFSRTTGGATSLNFCTPTFAVARTLAAGTSTVRIWVRNTAGSSCGIAATLYKNGTTSLGASSVTVPGGAALAVRTISIATSATALAVGDRLNLRLVQDEVKACDSTDIYYGGTTYDSHVVLSGLS